MTTTISTPVHRSSCGRSRSDRASISVEFAITMSALIVGFFTLMIGAGRIMQQENDVRSAAQAAARAASLRDGFQAASDDVEAIVATNLAESGVTCEAQRAEIVSSAADFVPGGVVTVRVECVARPVGAVGLPANTYSYEASEVLDIFRSQP